MLVMLSDIAMSSYVAVMESKGVHLANQWIWCVLSGMLPFFRNLMDYSIHLVDSRAFLMDYNAILGDYRTILVDYRSLLGDSRANLVDYNAI